MVCLSCILFLSFSFKAGTTESSWTAITSGKHQGYLVVVVLETVTRSIVQDTRFRTVELRQKVYV